MDAKENSEKSKFPDKDDVIKEKEVENEKDGPSWYKRQDIWVWVSGLIFIAILIGLMMALGNARGWDAQSGHTHNTSLTSADRFMSEPYIEEPGVAGRYGTGATARWYYWKIKAEDRTVWTHFFAWIGYITHQIFIWGVIYYAQIIKAYEPLGKGRYSTDMKMFNWLAFGGNAFFHLLHLLNTHTTYDATATDVSISTSQGSVIMLLVFVVILEYRERGLFFGWPTMDHKDKISMKLRLKYGPINLVRRFHGYAFAWAAIYTFWYHPMENTVGHAMGFFYTWIIMLQGSLMYTKFHLNKYWRLFQELFVIVHGGVVASQTGGDRLLGTSLWPMFVFGFSLCFVLTQIYGLPFWTKIPTWCRVFPPVLYLGLTLWCYSWIPDAEGRTWVRLSEIIRIPGVYYLLFFVGWGLLVAFLAKKKKVPTATLR